MRNTETYYRAEERQAFKPRDTIINLQPQPFQTDFKEPNWIKSNQLVSKTLAISSRVGARKSTDRKCHPQCENSHIMLDQTAGQQKQLPRYMAPQRREPRKSQTVTQSLEQDQYKARVSNITRDYSPNPPVVSSSRSKDVSP